jgi:branched-chain amino acid transport system substrate-binding protein
MEVKGMFKPSRLVLLVIAAFMVFGLSFVACGGDDEDTGGGGGGGKLPVCDGAGCGETVGVTDTSIKIGTLLPMSNTTATAWGVPLSQGMKAYFDYINDKGGIYGRKLELVVGDSQYTGPVASETAKKLTEQDQVFGFMGNLGTEAEMAVYTYLQEKGVPDMFILTGDKTWVEPIVFSRSRFLVDYEVEGRILGKYIGENYDGKKLGILAQNDQFGKDGEVGLKLGLEDAGATMETTTQYYDATQTDVTAQMQRLKADGAEVIGFYGMPAQASGGIAAARTTLNWDVPFVITGVNAAQIVGALAGFANAEGAVSVSFGRQSDETEFPGVQQYQEIVNKYSPGTQINSINFTGYSVAAAMVAVLIQTGPDLTRTNFLNAAESICKYEGQGTIAPISMSPTDHAWNEAEIFVKAEGTSADTFRWKPFGDAITQYETTKDCKAPTPPADATKQPHAK